MPKTSWGPIDQNAYVVQSLETAIDYWTGPMGVGPFFVFPSPVLFTRATYHGVERELNIDAAVAYSGDLLIELIVPHDTPSIFREFADRGGKGVQHVGAFADNMKIAHAELESKGAKLIQWGLLPDESEIAYYDLGGGGQLPVFEVAVLKPDVRALFAKVKMAGKNWDGRSTTITF